MGTTLALAGCIQPKIDDPLPDHSDRNTIRACKWASYQDPFANSNPSVAKQRALNYLELNTNWSDADLSLISKNRIRIGMDIDAAACSWGARIVNRSVGHGYATTQYKSQNGHSYFYERNNSGIVDSISA